jgi:hypothetical protein
MNDDNSSQPSMSAPLSSLGKDLTAVSAKLRGASHFCNLDGQDAHPTGKMSGTGILPVQI